MKDLLSKVLTVTQLNRYIKQLIANDAILTGVSVSGEISNFKYHSSGHMYFTLKDEASLIKCVMFKSQNSRLKFVPTDGMKVVAFGYISVYEAAGQYQMYPEQLIPDGVGDLYKAFEQLKEKLSKEGLFDEQFKNQIPLIPKGIGVITSPTGSVIKDIINVLFRRFPNASLKLLPAAVQGELAGNEIAKAINTFNEIGGVDVIIIARGGGSLEELWPFNEEIVARSIFNSKIPIISAVDHETDFSISDFVADLRAPTPSAAAELVVPEKKVLENSLSIYKKRMENALLERVKKERVRLEKLEGSYYFKQPMDRINHEMLKIDNLTKHLNNSIIKIFNDKNIKLKVLAGKMEAMNPLSVVSRGYSLLLDDEGKVVKSVESVKKEELVYLQMIDGKLELEVKNILKEGVIDER